MARIARVVVPGCWHHVTQRGNRRQMVPSDDSDRERYLSLLAQHCRRCSVAIAGYCLMGNHVHWITVPASETGLARALGRAHNDYARWWNVCRGESGHVWQNRFYSCPLDERHRWEALRYVELNPVRAGLARDAAGWRWSSTAAHLTGVDQTELLEMAEWSKRWNVHTWREVLEQGVDNAALADRIREATRTGRPFGEEEFVARLEAQMLRPLRPRKRGPKPAAACENAQLELGA